MVHEKTVQVAAFRYSQEQLTAVTDVLAEEVPVYLEYNGLPYTVLLATPADLADLAVGFSLTEGVVANASEVSVSLIEPLLEGWRIVMHIAPPCFDRLMQRRRDAGMASVKSEKTIKADCAAISFAYTKVGMFTPAQLHSGFAQMEAQQILRMQTGATHAAAWMDETGQVALIREDVARHNALDKLIGAMAQKEKAFSLGAVLLTSRASHEMVRKCTVVGVGILAAISAPTALAVRAAKAAGLTLAAFVRQSSYTIYTCPKRLCEKRPDGQEK